MNASPQYTLIYQTNTSGNQSTVKNNKLFGQHISLCMIPWDLGHIKV